MRNPWGKGVWKTQDPVLQKINDEIMNGSKDEAGIFFMPFEELKINFEEISVCHYVEDYYYTQRRHKYIDNDIYPFNISISKSGEYYVTISKPDKRFTWSCNGDSFLSVVLVRKSKNGKSSNYAGGIGGIHRDPFFKAHLEKGEYIAFVIFVLNPGKLKF